MSCRAYEEMVVGLTFQRVITGAWLEGLHSTGDDIANPD